MDSTKGPTEANTIGTRSGESNGEARVIRLFSTSTLRRYSLGARPISRLKTRLKRNFGRYPTAAATSESDVLFRAKQGAALYIRHW